MTRCFRITVALPVGAALLSLSGCTHFPTAGPVAEDTRPTAGAAASPARDRPSSELDGGNQASPDAIARAAITALYGYDACADRSPSSAALRASRWMSPTLAAAVRGAPSISPADAEWTTWAEHRALITPQLAPGHDDRPADTARVAYRQYAVALDPRGRDGWQGPRRTVVVFVRLTRTRAVWSVDQVLPK